MKFLSYTKEQFKLDVLKVVEDLGDSVTYATLYRAIPLFNEFTDTEEKNYYALKSGEYENVILWLYRNKNCLDWLEELMNENVLVLVPSSQLNYMIEGIELNVPLAKGEEHYKEEHWLPVEFNKGINFYKALAELNCA